MHLDEDELKWIIHLRSKSVARCVKWRAAIKAGDKTLKDGTVFTASLSTFMLRKEQKMLLALRIWRTTGTYPELDN